MKKIISLLLTVVMLISMIVIPAGAVDGNAAIYYNGLSLNNDSWFQNTYCYAQTSEAPYVGRINESGAEHYGGLNYFMTVDFMIDDYKELSDQYTEFGFANLICNGFIHYGYNFTRKSFIVYDQYHIGGGLSVYPVSVLAEMNYDLEVDTWHEMAVRFVDKTITIYLDGVEMIKCDLETAYATAGNSKFMSDWDWQMKERPDTANSDLLMITGIGVEYYMDNIAFYSGDYDIAKGTASETYATDSDFVNMASKDKSFCCFNPNDSYSVDPNGGIEKVTYNRETASSHVHNMVKDDNNSTTAGCLTPGYDYYYCTNGCGATAKLNYVEPLGHLPGQLVENKITATDTESGVEYRWCTRAGCGEYYTLLTTLLNPDTNTNKAAHMYTDGSKNIYNGYVGIGNHSILAAEDGFTLIADIMPIDQTDDSIAKIYGDFRIGSKGGYIAGYDYENGKFYINDNNGSTVAEKVATLNNYEWAEWAFVRKGLDIALYIDGEIMVSTTMDSALVADVDSPEDMYGFLLQTPCCELLLDNIIFAGADYDLAIERGIVYDVMTFNENGYVVNTDGTAFLSPETGAVELLAYVSAYNMGWKIESYGLPVDEIEKLHEDRALKVDCNYTNGSINAYSQLDDSLQDLFATTGKLEYTFDFYAYDWCTDTEALDGGTAFIGGHINGNGVGNENSNIGNGFAGYDFIKQQAVIGCISAQAGGNYGENTQYADYAIAKNEWHTFTLSYDLTGLDEEGKATDDSKYVITVSIDGSEVISRTYGYYDLDVTYYIFFPNFVKGYLDNVTVKVNDVVYEDSTDYTNGYSLSSGGMTYLRGGANTAWNVVAGGVPTHTYKSIVTPASCLTDGYTTHVCACGESSYVTYDQIAGGHTWDDGVVETPATGSSTGVRLYTCTVCGETKTEEIPKAFSYGDVNDDSVFNASDLSLYTRKIGGASVKFNSDAGDVKSDNAVNSTDFSYVVRKSAGANVTFGPVA